MADKLNLMLHCGGQYADLEQVEAVNTPNPSGRWHPIPHVALTNLLFDRIESYGMKVVEQAHALSGNDGERYFGLFQVETTKPDSDFSLVFGLRNSHDKKFAAGICLGSGVFVCDNLAFSSEVQLGRRHTSRILMDLPNLMSRAMGRLVGMRTKEENRIAAYKDYDLNNSQAHDLIIEAMRNKAINTTRVPKVVEQWHTPAHPEFKERNMWSLFNAFTEVYKEVNINALPDATTKLQGLLDTSCGLVTTA